jgi:hypothetical protein
MLLSNLFRRKDRPRIKSYRPALCILEDRTVPSGGSWGGYFPWYTSNAGPATHLEVIAPENVQSGKSFEVEVEALDASGHLATGYTGTVAITLQPTDSGATLPADHTFSAMDHGKFDFPLTLAALGSEMILANDTAPSSTISGSATTTVNPAPVATQLMVITPEKATVGTTSYVTVIALDASGHRVSNYTGTVTLSAANATVTGGSYTFLTTDHGQHTFQVTYSAAATTETVSASGVLSTTTITGQASLQVFAAGAVTHFGIFTLGPAYAGQATQFEVVALNASNQVVPGYTGTVSFTSSDGGATLPNPTPFVTSDNGIEMFSATFSVAGNPTLTVTDGTVTSTVHIKVRSQPSGKFGWWGGWW